MASDREDTSAREGTTGRARGRGLAAFGLAPALVCSALIILLYDNVSDIGFVRNEEIHHSHPFEYPALTRPLYLAERAVNRSVFGISMVNVVVCTVVALLMVPVLRDLGADASLWVGAPVLALAGQNWDVITALTIALALRAWLRGDDWQAGVWLGLGTAFKLVPGVLLVPMLGAGGLRRTSRTALVAAAIVAAANLPLALRNPTTWWFPYKFAEQRTDIQATIWAALPLRGHALDVVAAAALVACLLAILVLTTTGRLPFPAAAALSILAFIATNKIWEPHYVLWALPALALAAVPHRPVRALEAVSLVLFVVLWRKQRALDSGLYMWTVGSLRLAALAAVLAVTVIGSQRGNTSAPHRDLTWNRGPPRRE